LREPAVRIAWLNKYNDIFIVVTESGSLDYYQVNFSNDLTVYADAQDLPKWLLNKSGSCFSWNSKFCTYNERFVNNILLHNLKTNEGLNTKILSFIEKAEKNDKTELLDEKINNSKDRNIILMWVALKSIFSSNHNELFRYFGYDRKK